MFGNVAWLMLEDVRSSFISQAGQLHSACSKMFARPSRQSDRNGKRPIAKVVCFLWGGGGGQLEKRAKTNQHLANIVDYLTFLFLPRRTTPHRQTLHLPQLYSSKNP